MSPGLVVMGGDSCPRGLEFKSQCRILGGSFSHLFVVQIVLMFKVHRTDEKDPKPNNLGSLTFHRTIFYQVTLCHVNELCPSLGESRRC